MSRTLYKMIAFLLVGGLLSACTAGNVPPPKDTEYADATAILLSDGGIRVDGKEAPEDGTAAVYVAKDIVYYEEGKDFTYGEGGAGDAHSAAEAAAHTVVHITKAGTYRLSGTLSKGQVAVDLGEDAEEDPDAVVTLILSGVDITCTVAPAVIFYNVYECGSDDADTATKDVDTASAGANVLIEDGTVNRVNGSYVARIYKPGSVELNEDGTAVEDAKKLHKYDAAFYSKMSMNVNGGAAGTGELFITAENEGLDSELHLTINGGVIRIRSGNDGINTNEDGVSVTTVNGGDLSIVVTGETGEGDGIDSNGWLVINGGRVAAAACSFSGDAGIDSDMGIHINGGTVLAAGSMLDRIEAGGQTYAVFRFAKKQSGSDPVRLLNAEGTPLMEWTPENGYSMLVFSSPALTPGDYSLTVNGAMMMGSTGGGREGFSGGFGGERPDMPENWSPVPGGQLPEGFDPEGGQPPEGFTPPEGGGERPDMPENWSPVPGGQLPEGFDPEGGQPPEGFTPPEGGMGRPGQTDLQTEFLSDVFTVQEGANTFSMITAFHLATEPVTE